MRRITLYPLIALLTFAVGIAASAVFNLGCLFGGRPDTPTPPPVPTQTVMVERREAVRTVSTFCGCQQESDASEPYTPVSPALSSDKEPIMGGVLNGKARSLPRPAYPPIARAARASGAVAVRVVIDEKGCISSARAESGHPLLQNAAVEAARSACFAPTRLSGQPVKVTGLITYNFVLQ